MTLTLVDKEDQVPKKRNISKSRSRGKIFEDYRLAIKNSLPFLRESIEKSQNGFIRIKVVDIKKEMGGEFVNKHPKSIIWALKFVLFDEGIFVKTGTHNTGEGLLLMRKRTDDDILPPSLEEMREENKAKEEENKVKEEEKIRKEIADKEKEAILERQMEIVKEKIAAKERLKKLIID